MPAPLLPLESLETFAHGLDHPEGICVTPGGTLYAGGEAGQIYRVGDDGAIEEIASTGGFILGLAADGEGRVYAIDSAASCVWRVDTRTAAVEPWARGPESRPFRTPNWGAFDAAGTYYLSDSGGWGAGDGCIWRIPPGGRPEVWSEASRNFPNGLAVAPDGSRLYVLESLPGALVEIEIRTDGSPGERRTLCDLDPAVPDGVSLTDDGAFLIACYRPDAVLRWHPDEGVATLADDPRGTVLAAPTNIAFTGPERNVAVVPNIGRWHLTRFPIEARGIAPSYPSKSELGS